jgi:hypothetical protein
MEALPKINILPSANIGKCGLRKCGRKDKFYFPLFLMGTCGDEQGVINWSAYKSHWDMPKKMDRAWFGELAKHLKQYGGYDWDWWSFRKNVLEPNREHIRIACEIKSDEILDRVIDDGLVLLGCYNKWETDDQWREEVDLEKDESFGKEGDKVGFPPNAKYFFTETFLEY